MSDNRYQNAIKEKFNDEIAKRKTRNGLHIRGGFIERSFLDEHLTERMIRSLLREDFKNETLGDTALEDLCKLIASRFKKTYTLLLIMDQAKYIRDICNDSDNGQNLNDDILFRAPFLKPERYNPKSFAWSPQGKTA
jgi:hypothetical protein